MAVTVTTRVVKPFLCIQHVTIYSDVDMHTTESRDSVTKTICLFDPGNLFLNVLDPDHCIVDNQNRRLVT